MFEASSHLPQLGQALELILTNQGDAEDGGPWCKLSASHYPYHCCGKNN